MNQAYDARIELLQGGQRQWWDLMEGCFVSSATVYIPFGCPDWGETNDKRNGLCAFCAIPNAVHTYRNAFYEGRVIPEADHIQLFRETLREVLEKEEVHTVMVFNAGSFLAMPTWIQEKIMRNIAMYGNVKRVVIESRAPLITFANLAPLVTILSSVGIHLTVRVGIETKDDHLRLRVLKKGHSKRALSSASLVMRALGVVSGGYVLLNPAPGLDPVWAEREAIETIRWILDSGGLDMDEVYVGATCVGPGAPLATSWEEGTFSPASLRSVLRVLQAVLPCYEGRVHLLPFSDEPAFLAVPSNHTPRGIPESLGGASGCDLLFHEMFAQYRASMDSHALHDIPCSCIS